MSAVGAGAGSGSVKKEKTSNVPAGFEHLLNDALSVVAYNGFAHDCRRVPFVSKDAYESSDLLVATKRVRYGERGRDRLHSLAWKGDVRGVEILVKGGADLDQYGQFL